MRQSGAPTSTHPLAGYKLATERNQLLLNGMDLGPVVATMPYKLNFESFCHQWQAGLARSGMYENESYCLRVIGRLRRYVSPSHSNLKVTDLIMT